MTVLDQILSIFGQIVEVLQVFSAIAGLFALLFGG
jgi:hypothetical protein